MLIRRKEQEALRVEGQLESNKKREAEGKRIGVAQNGVENVQWVIANMENGKKGRNREK